MEFVTLVQSFSSVGALAVFFLITLYLVVQIAIPALLKRDQDTHAYYRSEIEALRRENHSDKQLLLAAFKENTVAITLLNTSTSAIVTELARQNNELVALKEDVHSVYRMLATEKQLITRELS